MSSTIWYEELEVCSVAVQNAVRGQGIKESQEYPSLRAMRSEARVLEEVDSSRVTDLLLRRVHRPSFWAGSSLLVSALAVTLEKGGGYEGIISQLYTCQGRDGPWLVASAKKIEKVRSQCGGGLERCETRTGPEGTPHSQHPRPGAVALAIQWQSV